jgi:hypothetical protein
MLAADCGLLATSSSVSNSSSQFGGGLYVDSSPVTFTNCTLDGCEAKLGGVAVCCDLTSLSLLHSPRLSGLAAATGFYLFLITHFSFMSLSFFLFLF